MCYLEVVMYEGKNIHYSVVDNKPLCSFSSKLCNQRRLNGFGFCVRHILEDPTAPFHRCAYVAKSSNQMCTQAIPKNEDRRFCNNHMQVLGMLPRKGRKKKEKETNTVQDNRLPFRDRIKSKNNMTKLKSEVLRKEISMEDPDDPYAFPDPVKDTQVINSQPVCSLPLNDGLKIQVSHSKQPPGGTSSIARLYPELAEKLEKIRPKIEPRVIKEKGRIRSSRTMNKLQTKIAQNKIKDKLRKSQESGSNPSVSPASMPSPDQRDQSPGVMQASPIMHQPIHVLEGISAQGVTNIGVLGITGQGIPQGASVSSPGMTSGFDGASRESVQNITGFQQTLNHSSISQRLMSPHVLPPPYPGLTPSSQSLPIPVPVPVPRVVHSPSQQPLTSVAPPYPPITSVVSPYPPVTSVVSPYPPVTSIVPPYPPVTSKAPPYTPVTSVVPPYSTVTSVAPPYPPVTSVVPPHIPLPSVTSSSQSFHSVVSSQRVPVVVTSHQTVSSVIPPNQRVITEVPHRHPVPSVVSTTQAISPVVPTTAVPSSRPVPATAVPSSRPVPSVAPTHETLSTAVPPKPVSTAVPPIPVSTAVPPIPVPTTVPPIPVSTVTPTADPVVEEPTTPLPPPPPYVAPQTTLPVSTTAPKISVLLTRPQRLKNLFSAKDARTCLRSESAVNYYSFYAKRKLQNRYLINQGLCSSDDDVSEDEDIEMLPWQPEWFSASSDEDNNEDDQYDDLPLHVRATKLALLRARLRRQCNQSRSASRSNTRIRGGSNQATLALVKAIRDNSCAALRALWKIMRITPKSVDRFKRRGLEHRPCLIKDDEEIQCKNRALPYTNHCLKHIMYNVEQQLFDYCTAKFADNTQCCVPVFDIRHELPLCAEHGAKADNYQKTLHGESRKRPRKKTKPPALTRPPRKGKKKKKSRYVRPQKPVPESGSQPDEPAIPEEENGEESGSNIDVDVESTAVMADDTDDSDIDIGSAEVSSANTSKDDKSFEPALAGVELEEMLPPGRIEDIGKAFGELPLEQASRLLEEQDFQEVFNKIPDEAFDIFSGRNGEFEPSTEETEELERALAEATKDVYSAKDTLEKLLKGGDMSVEALSEELTRSIAESLSAQFASNSAAEGNLGKTAGEITHDGVGTLLRGPAVTGNAPGITGGVPTALTAQLLNRVHGLHQNTSVVIGQTGPHSNRSGVFSGTNALFTTVPSSLAGFPSAVTVVSARSNNMNVPNRTTSHPNFTAAPALAAYHGNLPYTALTHQLALSQQTSASPSHKTSSSTNEQLRADSNPRVLTLPQQLTSQPVEQNQISWQAPAVSGASVIYENGFPLSRLPFVQAVNVDGQVGKFPQHAQTTDYPSKQDPQFSLTHSIGSGQHPTGSLPIRAPTQPTVAGVTHNSVQGFITKFALGRPPFTSSSTGS